MCIRDSTIVADHIKAAGQGHNHFPLFLECVTAPNLPPGHIVDPINPLDAERHMAHFFDEDVYKRQPSFCSCTRPLIQKY